MNRYSLYKDSGVEWIGEIPSEWEIIPVKRLSELVNGSTPKGKSEYWDGDIYWITPSDIGPVKENKYINETRRKITQEGLDSCGCSLSPSYSLVITNRGPIGNVIIPIMDFTTNQGCKVLIPNNLTSVYFLYYVIKSSVNELEVLGQGTTFLELSSTSLNNFRLPLPPLNEQHQIVSYLDNKTSSIDSLIQSKEKKIELLKEKRTSLINQVVTKGLNPDVEMKDSGVEWIGEIPSHWTKIKLNTLVTSNKLEFQDGNHGGLHPLPEEFIEEGVPFIKPKDIQNERVLWDSCDRLPIERCEQFRIGFSNNDDVLLVNRGGSIGKVVYVSDYNNEFSYFVINPQVTYLRGKNSLVSKYLFFISLSDIFQCGIDLILGHGSTFPFLGLSNMGDFEIVFPDETEQLQIVSYLDKETKLIDETISSEQKKIELLKEYKQSLISEVVTGKRKVITDE